MSTTLQVAMSIRQRGPSPSWQLRFWMQSQKRSAPVCLPWPRTCGVSPPTKDEPSPSEIWCFGIVYGSPKKPIRHRLNSDKETTSMKASVQAVPAGEVALSESTPIETTLYDLIAAIAAEVGPHEEQVVTATVVHILNAYRVTCTGNWKGFRLVCDTTALRRRARTQKIRSAFSIE